MQTEVCVRRLLKISVLGAGGAAFGALIGYLGQCAGGT